MIAAMQNINKQTWDSRITNLLLSAGLLAFGICSACAQTEVKVWSKLVGTPLQDCAGGVAVDPSGNMVIGGATLGSLGGQSAGTFDVFAGKYDPSGNELWLAQRGTIDIEYGWDNVNTGVAGGVATDPFGNVYVVGRTDGALDGNANLGKFDFFVVKFGPSGQWLWTKQDGTANDDNARAVATDGAASCMAFRAWSRPTCSSSSMTQPAISSGR